jgi:signal transduction histidine kinase
MDKRRILSWVLIGYMLLAFTWWAYHLWQQTDEIFIAKRQLLELNLSRNNRGINETQFLQTSEYRGLEANRDKQRRMILGEGSFFTICLIVGLYLLLNSANKEAALGRQRRNFMLSITHELKSPLASMRLILETLGKHSLSRDQQQKICADGIREAGRLQSLVESLLLGARLENNWRPLPEAINLKSLVNEIVHSLEVRFPDAHFKINIPDDFPSMSADKVGLTSVILNLLENAVKYSPEGGLIQFTASQTNKRKTLLQVSDEGQGIPDAEKKSVFEKFYRIGNEETRNTQGTGLGLFIVRRVVHAHGGTILIQDNKPAGTIFSIEM